MYKNGDIKLSRFLVIYYFIEAINLTIKSIFYISPILWRYLSIGFMLLLFAFMILSIYPILKRNLLPFVYTELIFIIFYLLSLLQDNAILSLLMENGFRTLGVCIPLAFYVYSIQNKEILFSYLLKSSYALIIIISLGFIFNRNSEDAYSMSLSYALLIPMLLQINEFFKNKRLLNFMIAGYSIAATILYGSRGPLLCVIFILLLKYLLSGIYIVKKTIYLVVVGLTGGLFVVFFDKIIELIMNIFTRFNIYSRTIIMLANGKFFSGTGRSEIYNYYWGLANEKPLFGWGLLGGWIKAGSGPHNMLLEFLLAFGFIGGGILCIFSIMLLIKVFFIKDTVLKDLITIYCAANIAMFFISGNFIEKVDLFIFMALYFSKDKKNKEKDTITVPVI
jgi:hypothetical protein